MTYDHVLSKCKGLPEFVEDIGRVTYYLRWQLRPQRHRFFNYKQHGGQKDMAADKKFKIIPFISKLKAIKAINSQKNTSKAYTTIDIQCRYAS